MKGWRPHFACSLSASQHHTMAYHGQAHSAVSRATARLRRPQLLRRERHRTGLDAAVPCAAQRHAMHAAQQRGRIDYGSQNTYLKTVLKFKGLKSSPTATVRSCAMWLFVRVGTDPSHIADFCSTNFRGQRRASHTATHTTHTPPACLQLSCVGLKIFFSQDLPGHSKN